jgi:hypothetical protein
MSTFDEIMEEVSHKYEAKISDSITACSLLVLAMEHAGGCITEPIDEVSIAIEKVKKQMGNEQIKYEKYDSYKIEKHILGNILLDESLIDKAIELGLTKDYFIIKENKEIYAAIIGLYVKHKSIDLITVKSKCKTVPVSYLSSLTDNLCECDPVDLMVCVIDKATVGK